MRRFENYSQVHRSSIGRDRFIRNVLIAAGNSGEPNLVSNVKRLLDDTSPVVRAMAVWALGQLSYDEFVSIRSKISETDADILKEWNAA